MKISTHPFWLVGFRPFFALACLSGLSLPLVWTLLYLGGMSGPQVSFTLMQWHAHEMFFGFGWAVLGGFLLTATKNWVGVRGYHGNALIFLSAAWLFERIGMWWEGGWPTLLFRISNYLFLAAIKLLGGVLVFAGWLPPDLAVLVYALLAALLLLRLAFWHPQLALRRLDIGIMYLGYLALAAQLLLEVLAWGGHSAWVGGVSVHVFTFGVMGLIIPAMMIRISNGHTGRPVKFDGIDTAVLRIALLAFILRILVPQFFPDGYAIWIALAALCWCLVFSILGWRYIPHLLQPRVDGKEH